MILKYKRKCLVLKEWALQDGRMRVRLPRGSLGFCIDLNLLVALWLCFRLKSLTARSIMGYLLGVKAARA